MARTAERKLSSQERCIRAFRAWADAGDDFKGRPIYRLVAWNAWQACWAHLERQYQEFVQS